MAGVWSRSAILRNWQRSVEADPELTTLSSLSRAQFSHHIPQVLAAFERRLDAETILDYMKGVGHDAATNAFD